MTDRDAFWATRIIMGFKEEDLAAIIKEANYPQPEAEEYLLRTLMARKNTIAKTWFQKMTPLDEFKVLGESGSEPLAVEFQDLAVVYNIEDVKGRNYFYSIEFDYLERPLKVKKTRVPAVDGLLQIPLSRLPFPIPSQLRISIEVFQDDKTVGGGVELFVYCWKTNRCTITGLNRHY
jgi:hypothetical protein